jgi:DNA-binding beta-propeller fold protein YncE
MIPGRENVAAVYHWGRVVVTTMALTTFPLSWGQPLPKWNKPDSGWLYVLDTNDEKSEGRILLLNPEDGSIQGAIATGYQPNFALSHDGRRLYVTAGVTGLGTLSAIDTSTGSAVNTVSVADHLLYAIYPSAPLLAVSSDDKHVFVETRRTVSPGVDEYSLSTFDVEKGRFMPQLVAIPGCGPARFIEPVASGWDIQVLCSHTNSVRFVKITSLGGIERSRDVALAWAPQKGPDGLMVPSSQRVAASAHASPDGKEVVAIMTDGRISTLSTDLFQTIDWVTTPSSRWIPQRPWPAAPDGTVVYVGVGQQSDRGVTAGQLPTVLVFRTPDWKETGKLQTSTRFRSLSLNKDGTELFALNPVDRTILVINAQSLKEVRKLSSIGQTPTLLLVAP